MNSKFQWMCSPDNDKVLILMRGIPSAGKSFRANELANGDSSIIFSADKFWGSTPEEYVANWCVERLSAAHRWCQNLTRASMQRQNKLVIVDNTNTMIREMRDYFDLAVQYQYHVQIEEPTSSWWVNDIAPFLCDKEKNKEQLKKMCKFLFDKNQETHKVPLENIEKMLFRYQPQITFENLAKDYENRHP